MTRTSIRLAIIANQRTLLEGAELWFGRDGMEADLIIVESRWSGFMVAAFDITPDVVILDMSMDDKNSVAMKLGALKHLGVRVLLTGDRPPVEVVRSALEAGAAGFVCRTAGFAVMAEAVMEVDSGRRYVSAAMSASLAKPSRVQRLKLSPQEVRVVSGVGSDMTMSEVAARLGISKNTAMEHLKNARNKGDAAGINIRTLISVHQYAGQAGYLDAA